jgi:hypothetical protein
MPDEFQAEQPRDPRPGLPREYRAEEGPEDNPFRLTERRSPLPRILIGPVSLFALMVLVGAMGYWLMKPLPTTRPMMNGSGSGMALTAVEAPR